MKTLRVVLWMSFCVFGSALCWAEEDHLSCKGSWSGHWQADLSSSNDLCECHFGQQQWMLKSKDRLSIDTVTQACESLCTHSGSASPEGQCQPIAALVYEFDKSRYPLTRESEVSDVLHGVKVPDPYRWLEDDRSSETEDWVKRQQAYTQEYLMRLPARSALKSEIESVWNYAKMSTPILIGSGERERLFYTYNDGLQNQAVLYTRYAHQKHNQAHVVLDPNRLSSEGTLALKSFKVSQDGYLIAYQFAKAGSDWVEIKVRDVRSGLDLGDHLKWVKFSDLAWDKSGEGFYYSRYDEPTTGEQLTGVNEYQKLFYHRIGEAQSQDQLIYARSDHKDWGFSAEVSEEGDLLIISVWRGASEKNQLFYKRLNYPNQPVIPLIDHFNHSYSFLGNQGDQVWLMSDRDAPKGQVITLNLKQPDPSQYKVIIPEREEALTSAQMVGGRLALHYIKDATSRVRFANLWGGDQGELPLDSLGNISSLSGSLKSPVSYFTVTHFTQPPVVFRYDHEAGSVDEIFRPKLAIDVKQFKTEQVFIPSTQGAKVPAFIISSIENPANKPRPTLLYGYGGFNISLMPYFKPDLLPWLKRGGVYVVANLRGGGEYGEAWHIAGMRENKQNVFDDFIHVAEWLVKEGRTRPDLLGIHGGSNGGLLVGACAQQRPDLFAAALPAVGVMDMLRFHKFTIGWAWKPEYGDPDVEADFKILHAYSPVHNLKRGSRAPATLIMTADHDDRVVPAHSFKYAATLQASHGVGGPALIRIDSQAGHGAGTPTSKRIEAAADLWSFLSHHLKLGRLDQ